MVLLQTRTGKVLHAAGKIDGGQEEDPWYFTACGLDEWAWAVGDYRWEVVADGEVACKRCLKALAADRPAWRLLRG